MKKEKRVICFYTDDKVKKSKEMLINVDDNSIGWLSPSQVDHLECLYLREQNKRRG